MDHEEIGWHYSHPARRGHLTDHPHQGSAGGAACGDLVTMRVQVEGGQVVDGGFDAEGCPTLIACASLALDAAVGGSVEQAALLGTEALSEMMGGLSPGKLHAADLVGDALAIALGKAVAAGDYLPEASGRVMVAMSGGVDSSLVCALMEERDLEPMGVTVELWRDAENDAESSCCSISAVRRARTQAHRLGIPHFTLQLHEEFRRGVVEPWIHGHRDGLTLNPCVTCNGEVRLDLMVDFAMRLGVGRLATGHYARLQSDDQGTLVAQAADRAKDQSYMLSGVNPDLLARLELPLGEMGKTRVRQMAQERGLIAAKIADSQDLCFLAGTDRPRFLARHGGLAERPGRIVDLDGKILGTHRGHHLYTVGQRKGLEAGGAGQPLYVLRVEAKLNQVVVGGREDLSASRVALRGIKLWRDSSLIDGVRLRSKAEVLPAGLLDNLPAGRHPRSQMSLYQPAEGGVSPGQVACLMSGQSVVGMAIISPA